MAEALERMHCFTEKLRFSEIQTHYAEDTRLLSWDNLAWLSFPRAGEATRCQRKLENKIKFGCLKKITCLNLLGDKHSGHVLIIIMKSNDNKGNFKYKKITKKFC